MKKSIAIIIIAVMFFASGLAHSYNMFNYPYYENDEGVYLSQAWSLIKYGSLAPYTYWYDHAPAGWILLAVWIKLTGGFFTFGHAINTGRVFMLIIHQATVLLVFYAGKRLSGSLFPGLVANIIFSFSPLAIYFQRRLLLDNIMIFWIMLSLALIVKKRFRLSLIFLSAITFGIGVLTKEVAVFLLPAFVYAVYRRTQNQPNRNFAVIQWMATAGFVISLYFLYALLKGELFPFGLLSADKEHVSLLSALAFQFGRGRGLPFWNPQSDFFLSLNEWLGKDAFTVICGATGTVVSLILAIKVQKLRIPALLALFFWFFLIRGDLIINFYVLPAIPLLALNLGLLLQFLFGCLPAFVNRFFKTASLALILSGIFFTSMVNPYTRNETKPQIQSVNWIKENLAEDTYIIIDNYAFVDLHEPRFLGDKVFNNADWFWKLDYDPAIKENKLNNDWRRIEYIALSHEMVKQMKYGTQKTLRIAFDNAHPLVEWRKESIAYIDLKKFISTNGDWQAILKVNKKEDIALKQSWEGFKKKYIINYGQVIDPQNSMVTTAEGQASTLLRAVWMDDEETFSQVWQWTKNHLCFRQQDKLLSRLWIKEGNDYKLGDWISSSEADIDAALALLFASKKWRNETYLAEAKVMIADIWQQEVVPIAGRYYLVWGNYSKEKEGYPVAPSAYSPAAFQIFAQIDPKHPWLKLKEDSYFLLEALGRQSKGYIPNLVKVDEQTAQIKIIPDQGQNTHKTVWRVALDAFWFKNKNAQAWLKMLEPTLEKEWSQNQSLAIGSLTLFSITNQQTARQIYDQTFDAAFDANEGLWQNQNAGFDQAWGWFATALFTKNLPNLWK